VQAALFQENGMLVLDQLEHILQLLYHTPSSIIAQRFNLTPERARILPAGAIIWRELVHWSHVSYWHISRSGLRDGALYLFFQYESGWRAWLQRYTTEHVPILDTMLPKAHREEQR
jgi:exopolyphosphatase/pppGpp-phosphohydrolase